MDMNGHMIDTTFSLPRRAWSWNRVGVDAFSTSFIDCSVANLLASGNRQHNVSVLNLMPSTLPIFVGPKDLSKLGQTSASSSPMCLHRSWYDFRNSSHQPLFPGATIGVSSNCRRTNRAGVEQTSLAKVLTVFATTSKFCTELQAPNI
jgi:hypothetical protein